MKSERATDSTRQCACFVSVVSSVILCLALATPASADDFTVDQANVWFPFDGSFHSIDSFAPVGQEFVPSLPSLDIVELVTEDGNFGDGQGVVLLVRIRLGNALGEVLGTSLTVSLPDWSLAGVTTFAFEDPVPLSPGQLHVIELVRVGGGGWMFHSTDDIWGNDPYPYGSTILLGEPHPNMDAWFREGVTHMSAVVPATWSTVKALYLH